MQRFHRAAVAVQQELQVVEQLRLFAAVQGEKAFFQGDRLCQRADLAFLSLSVARRHSSTGFPGRYWCGPGHRPAVRGTASRDTALCRRRSELMRQITKCRATCVAQQGYCPQTAGVVRFRHLFSGRPVDSATSTVLLRKSSCTMQMVSSGFSFCIIWPFRISTLRSCAGVHWL